MKKYLLTGLLVWLPLAVTVWVLSSVVGVLDGVFTSLLIGAIHQVAGRQRQAERCFRQAVSLQGCSPQQAEMARQQLAGFGKGRTAKR